MDSKFEKRSSAIVLGASIGGLLSARALSDHSITLRSAGRKPSPLRSTSGMRPASPNAGPAICSAQWVPLYRVHPQVPGTQGSSRLKATAGSLLL